MRTVDDFARIRQLHRDGLSTRHIARQLRVGRDTVRKALQNSEPQPYTLAEPRTAPVFGPFRPIVDAILAADESAPRKQRHTGTRIHRRLVAEHGFTGSYDPIRRYLKARRVGSRPTFIPLDHAPGHRAEADFGYIAVDFPDGRRSVPVLVVTWSHSNAPFALAARDRTCGGNAEAVGVRFDRDRAAALPVPARPFDPCVVHPAVVDKYPTARFDGNGYGVPRRFAFRPVTVKGSVGRVAVVADGAEVASHPRSYARGGRVLDPRHFLVVLETKPAALGHAPVYRGWHLPAAFADLRRCLEARLGPRAGARQYIRVLQLLARHPVDRVERAIAAVRNRGDPTAAAVPAAADRPAGDTAMSPGPPAALPAVAVPRPDLSRFDRLLTRSTPQGDADARPERPALEGQPEVPAAADDAGRARHAGPGGGRPG